MQVPERLCNVAIPADGPVRGQRLLKILKRDLGPLKGLSLFVDERRGMIMPVDFGERLVAIGALHSFVPAIDKVGDQTSLRRLLNLRQTLLAAAGHFRPARTFA